MADEPLHDLTGAPTRNFYTNTNQQELWNRVLEGEKNNYIMCCSTYGEDTGELSDMEATYGLACGHAYSLLAAYDVTIQGKKVKLLKIRNPWGNNVGNYFFFYLFINLLV